MGLLPVKQKNKPSAERQVPPDLANMLAANRSTSLGQQQTLSDAATRLAESKSKLPAALHQSASASRHVPLPGSASQIQAASNPPFERQVPHITQQVQERPGITDVQKDNLQRTLHMISEIAPSKRPDEMLLRFVMSKAEPMEAPSIRMIVEAWNQQHEQQLLQQHRQQLLLQQKQKQLQQQQQQHQEQGQRRGSTATEYTVASYAQQPHVQADSNEVKQQPTDTQQYPDSSSMDSDFEQSSQDKSEDQLGSRTSSAEHSHDQAAGQQKKTLSYPADGQQRSSPLSAEGQQRAFPRQTEGQHGHSRQSALQQGAATHLQHEHAGDHAQQRQQQLRQGQLQGQGLWPPSSLAQIPDANSNPLLQEGMPYWQRQMLRQAHAQQLALTQQSNGARSLAHVLQQVSANPVEPQAQCHAQSGESQEESVPAAQARQRKAEQGPSPRTGAMTGMRKGSNAESPTAVMQTRSPSLQRSGSLQRDESAGRVSLDIGMPPEPLSAEQGYHSQRLQTHQPHRLQGQWQQPQFSQGQLHESKGEQSRPPSQGAQHGYFRSQQPQPQQSQEGLSSQQPSLVNEAPQLSHLSRLASMSDDPPGQHNDAVRSELHAIQQQLLAQSRSRSLDADKQAKGQMPEALPASRLRAGAKDLLSQMHEQQAASRPASPSSQDLADKADAISMSHAAPAHAQPLPWLQAQQQQQQQHSAWQNSVTEQTARQSDSQFQDDAAAGQQGIQVKPHGVTVGSGRAQAGQSSGGQLYYRQSDLQSAGSGQLQSRLSGQQQSGQLQTRLSGQQQSEQMLSESSGLQSSASGQMQSRQSSQQSLGLGQSELQSHGSVQLRSGLQSAGPGRLQSGQRQAGQMQAGQLPEAVRQQVARLNALRAAERQMSEQKQAFADKQQQQQPSQHTPASTPASHGYSPSVPSQQLPGDIAAMKAGMPQQLTSLQRAQMLIWQHQLQAMQFPNSVETVPGALPDSMTSHDLGNKPGTALDDAFGGQLGLSPDVSPASMPGIAPSNKPGGPPGDTKHGLDRHTSSSTAAVVDTQRKVIASLPKNPKGSDWGQPTPGFVPSTSSPRQPQSLGTPNAAFSYPGSGSSPRLSPSQGFAQSRSASPASSPRQSQPLGAQMHPPATVPRLMQTLGLDTALGRVQAAHLTHDNGCSRPSSSKPGPVVSAAMAVDQLCSSETLLHTHLSPQNCNSISSGEANRPLSPAPEQSPSATADPRASEAVPAGSTDADDPGSTTPTDSVASGLPSQLKPRPEGSGNIAELQRRLQQMHSHQGRAGAAKPQQQRQSQSPAAQRGTSLTVSPSVSGDLSLSANQSASLSASLSLRAVSRGSGMEGRSLNLDAKATLPFSQPKASPAHQTGFLSVGHNTFLGTQDRQPPAAQHNLPPAPASGLLVPSHMSITSAAFQLTASSNAPATATPAGQQRASPAGSPRAVPVAQHTQSPADRPIASQAAQTSFAACEGPRASPAAQQRASPAPECTAPLQAEPTIAGASTQRAGSRLPSSLPFMALHGQLERQLPDMSKEALARSMGAPPPPMGTVHSQTVINNISGLASISGADQAQQGNTSTAWPAYFASTSAAVPAPFSGPSMASAMRARSGSPAIRAGASSAALKARSCSPVVRHVSDSPGLKAHSSNFAGAAPSGPGNRVRPQNPAVRAMSGSPDFTSRAGQLKMHGQGLGHQAAAVLPRSSSPALGTGPWDQPQPVPDPVGDQSELCQSSTDAQTQEAGSAPAL
ncbi:TPA: hypothetical protein ACH3X1_009762 [Trebouxia sp. C0004]